MKTRSSNKKAAKEGRREEKQQRERGGGPSPVTLPPVSVKSSRAKCNYLLEQPAYVVALMTASGKTYKKLIENPIPGFPSMVDDKQWCKDRKKMEGTTSFPRKVNAQWETLNRGAVILQTWSRKFLAKAALDAARAAASKAARAVLSPPAADSSPVPPPALPSAKQATAADSAKPAYIPLEDGTVLALVGDRYEHFGVVNKSTVPSLERVGTPPSVQLPTPNGPSAVSPSAIKARTLFPPAAPPSAPSDEFVTKEEGMTITNQTMKIASLLGTVEEGLGTAVERLDTVGEHLDTIGERFERQERINQGFRTDIDKVDQKASDAMAAASAASAAASKENIGAVVETYLKTPRATECLRRQLGVSTSSPTDAKKAPAAIPPPSSPEFGDATASNHLLPLAHISSPPHNQHVANRVGSSRFSSPNLSVAPTTYVGGAGSAVAVKRASVVQTRRGRGRFSSPSSSNRPPLPSSRPGGFKKKTPGGRL